MDQSLNPDRCLPSLLQKVPLGPGELLVPLPKWKVCVPHAHEILWSRTSLLGCVQWFKAFDIYTGAQHRDKLLAADSVSSTLDGAGAVQLGLWVGLVSPEGLANSCWGNGNPTASRKPETWKRTQEAPPASLPRLIIILWKLDIHLWFPENLREISKIQIQSQHPSALKHSDGFMVHGHSRLSHCIVPFYVAVPTLLSSFICSCSTPTSYRSLLSYAFQTSSILFPLTAVIFEASPSVSVGFPSPPSGTPFYPCLTKFFSFFITQISIYFLWKAFPKNSSATHWQN